MSLDVMRFLRDDFLHKYKKLRKYWSSIDEPLRKLFEGYEAQLNGIDIASLQADNKDVPISKNKGILDALNCAADDCLVEVAESLRSKVKRTFRRCKQGKSLETWKADLEKNLETLKSVVSSQCGSSITTPHKPASIPLLNYAVHGFQGQFDDIVNKICSSSKEEISSSSQSKMQAVGIVGIGGSGKTTLASLVFNSREVREKYRIMIWASLTSTLNKKESTRCSVFREILSGVQDNDSLKTLLRNVKCYQGGGGRGSKMPDHTLDKHIEQFKETLSRNRGKYLIVLDDVWETEYWFADKEEGPVSEEAEAEAKAKAEAEAKSKAEAKAKCILSRDWIKETGGTVVVTSRLEEMAENIVGKGNLHMILENKACYEIFLDRATKDGHFKREDERLKKLKKDIEYRCYGLPLAACTVADIIVAKHLKEVAEKERTAKAEAEAAKVKAEAERESGGSKADAEGEADVSKAKGEAEAGNEADVSKAKAEAEAEGHADASDAEGEADVSKPKAEAEAEGHADTSDAEGEADVSKAKAEAEADGQEDVSKAKVEADTGKEETDVSKAKAEAEGEVGTSKTPTEAEGDASVSKARADAEAIKAKTETDPLEAKTEAEGEAETVKAKVETDAVSKADPGIGADA